MHRDRKYCIQSYATTRRVQMYSTYTVFVWRYCTFDVVLRSMYLGRASRLRSRVHSPYPPRPHRVTGATTSTYCWYMHVHLSDMVVGTLHATLTDGKTSVRDRARTRHWRQSRCTARSARQWLSGYTSPGVPRSP